MSMQSIIRKVVCAGICLITAVSWAQTPPTAIPKAKVTSGSDGAYNWFARFGLACGAGASSSSFATKPTAQCGGIVSMPFFELETGVMGPQASQSAVSGYLSTNVWVPLLSLRDLGNQRGVPLLIGGYTNMFQTGNALDYGVAFAHPVDNTHSIQFEVRDYWAAANPAQHNVVFRVVWLVGLPD